MKFELNDPLDIEGAVKRGIPRKDAILIAELHGGERDLARVMPDGTIRELSLEELENKQSN